MRFSLLILAGALLAGCDGPGGEQADAGNSAGVTVPLPPPLPAGNDSASGGDPQAPQTTVAEAPEPKAPPEPKAEPEPKAAEPAQLVSSRPPIPVDSLAGYIRGAGFECDQVVNVSRVPRQGIYKFDCTTGGSYRGTMRSNHLYFRPWSGRPDGT